MSTELLDPPELEGIEQLPLKTFAEQAYLDYSMYVILDRALPHLGDGLKPVQRRIVYAMSELGLSPASKPKKSARTVGDVIGKFHPHGDSACYEAMVIMAQRFAYRYPLIDGQGNWGSPDDPKSFAAMRYTEARLTPYSTVLLAELGQGTVDWQPNFDGTLNEPKMLPARLPNVLLNGTTGIAVGMATDIPPHNMREIAAACDLLLGNAKADLDALMACVPAPDFATRAEIITPVEEIRRIYETGNGQIRLRAVWEKEDNGDVVITELPHQVSGARILEQIAAQMRAKKLPLVEDLRDESDHENPTRLVLTPRSNRVDLEALMAHLCATTDLERSYRVNINVIGLDGKPGVRGLREVLVDWIKFRLDTVRRRLEFRLDQVRDRLHILDALLIAFLNIDEVIAIIRTEDDPKSVLRERFGLTDVQAEAVLNLRLRHLMKLEEMKIRGEQDALAAERDSLEKTLGSKAKLRKLVAAEIREDAEQYGDDRRSPIVQRSEARAFDENALTPSEPVTVILSKAGWIRSGKGHQLDPEGLAYKAGDEFLAMAQGRTSQSLVLLDSSGRSYSLPSRGLPSARSLGEPLTTQFNPADGAGFTGLVFAADGARAVLGSDAGYGFSACIQDMQTRNKAGKACVTLPRGASLMPMLLLEPGDDWQLALISSAGRLLIIEISEVPEMSRGKGNKLMALKGEERLQHWGLLPAGSSLRIAAGRRSFTLKASDTATFQGKRASRGALLPRGLRNVDALIIEGT